MTRGLGGLFVGALVLFAVLGLLAGAPPGGAPREAPSMEVPTSTDVSPPTRSDPIERTTPRIAVPPTGSPAALARAWGRLSANWSARGLPAQLQAMAESASSTLATDLEHAVAAVVQGGELSQNAGSRGSVEAVAVRGAGDRRRLLVVTREEPLPAGDGHPGAKRYRVYIGVAVRHDDDRWRMARWERQP
jgi:hypothetical protein